MESLNMVTAAANSVGLGGGPRKTSIYQQSSAVEMGPKSGLLMLTPAPGVGAVKSIQQLFLSRGELTDLNNKAIRQLTAAAAFMGRLLRMNMIDFKLEHLIGWLSLSIHWPYHTALLTIFVEEQHPNLTARHSLLQIHEQVIATMANNKEALSPDIELLQRDDRDFTKVDQYIRKEIGPNLTFSILKYFMTWSPFMNPYFRSILKDYLINKHLSQTRGSRIQLTSPQNPVACLSEHSDGPLEEDMPRPVTSPTNQLANQITSWSKTSFANLANKADRPKTPIAIKRCMVKLKDGYPGKDLSQLDKHEIGVLMSQIEGLSCESNIGKYKEKLISLNVTGLVLSVCDMDQLQLEMDMTFGDWQLFRTLVQHLRAVEAFKSEGTLLDASGGGGDPNHIWTEADMDDGEEEESPPPEEEDEDEEEEGFVEEEEEEERPPTQNCWPSYSRVISHRTASTANSRRSKTTGCVGGGRGTKKQQSLPVAAVAVARQGGGGRASTAAVAHNPGARKASQASGPGYIYSPLATDELATSGHHVIANSHSVEPPPVVPSHHQQQQHQHHQQQQHKQPQSHGRGPQKTSSNASLASNKKKRKGHHALGGPDGGGTVVAAAGSTTSIRSLSQSQERIHLVRARTCPAAAAAVAGAGQATVGGGDRCATYIPVLLQTSSAMGGCLDLEEQECTCDYWFRIEHGQQQQQHHHHHHSQRRHNGGGGGSCGGGGAVCTSSEPASRAGSRPQTSPEGSDYDYDCRHSAANAYWPESVNKPTTYDGSAV